MKTASRFAFVLFYAALAVTSVEPLPAADPSSPEDQDICRKNFNLIYEAIQAYRRGHHDLPKWLSDLVPNYLADSKTLVCPAFKRSGESGASLRSDRADHKAFTTYTYEFADMPLGVVWNGWGTSTRLWKRRQMGLVGSDLPIVRCHQHAKVQQLTFDGRLVEGTLVWEYAHTNLVNYAEFSPRVLVWADPEVPSQKSAVKPLAPIPARSPQASPRLLDFTGFYDGSLTAGWMPDSPTGRPADKNLPLPMGLQEFGGVEFDVRGVIQLAAFGFENRGVTFPNRLDNIPVGQRCRRIHFLHGNHSHDNLDARVGTYRIHYANRQEWEVPIIYGRDIVAWIGSDYGPQRNQPCVVWFGTNAVTRTGEMKLRISKATWENPFPDQLIASLDFLTVSQYAGPFLIAVTAEQ